MNGQESSLLLALQHGDNFFPGGTQAFSWGLETLVADGVVSTAKQLNDFVTSQLKWRWNYCDRPVLVACYRAGQQMRDLFALDEIVETRSLSQQARECSKRAGEAILIVHSQLGHSVATEYRKYVLSGQAYGHNAVAQGLIWQALGIDSRHAESISAHLLRTQLVSAALRLGVIGHIDAQMIIFEQQSVIERLLGERTIPVECVGSFTPQIEIALMRHEVQTSRLFVN